MAIDTLAKRNAAFLDPCGTLIPDGAIGAADRQTLVGCYLVVPTITSDPFYRPRSSESSDTRRSSVESTDRRFSSVESPSSYRSSIDERVQ